LNQIKTVCVLSLKSEAENSISTKSITFHYAHLHLFQGLTTTLEFRLYKV